MTTVKTCWHTCHTVGDHSLKQVLILMKTEIVLKGRFFQCKVCCSWFSEVSSVQRPGAVMPSTATNNRRLILLDFNFMSWFCVW